MSNKRKLASLRNEIKALQEKNGLKADIIKRQKTDIKDKLRALKRAKLSNTICKLILDCEATKMNYAELHITQKQAKTIDKQELIAKYNELLAIASILQELDCYSAQILEDCAVMLAGVAKNNKKREQGNQKTEKKLAQLEQKISMMEKCLHDSINTNGGSVDIVQKSRSAPFMPSYGSSSVQSS